MRVKTTKTTTPATAAQVNFHDDDEEEEEEDDDDDEEEEDGDDISDVSNEDEGGDDEHLYTMDHYGRPRDGGRVVTTTRHATKMLREWYLGFVSLCEKTEFFTQRFHYSFTYARSSCAAMVLG